MFRFDHGSRVCIFGTETRGAPCTLVSEAPLQMGFCAAHFTQITTSGAFPSIFEFDALYDACKTLVLWAEKTHAEYACDERMSGDIVAWGGLNPIAPYIGFWVVMRETVHVPEVFASMVRLVCEPEPTYMAECGGRVLPLTRTPQLVRLDNRARMHSFAACPAVPPPLPFPMKDLEFLSQLTGLVVTLPRGDTLDHFCTDMGPFLSLLAPNTVHWNYAWKAHVFSHLCLLLNINTQTVCAGAAIRWDVRRPTKTHAAPHIELHVSLLASAAHEKRSGYEVLVRLVDHLAPALAAAYRVPSTLVTLEPASRPLVRVYKRMQFAAGSFSLVSPRPGALDLELSVPARMETHFESRFAERHKPETLPCVQVASVTARALEETFKPLIAVQRTFKKLLAAAWDEGPLDSMMDRMEAPLAQLGAATRSFFSAWPTHTPVPPAAWLLRQRALLRAYIQDVTSDPDFV